jgi:hypothetical protein
MLGYRSTTNGRIMEEFADLVNKYGFPIIAAGGLGYFVYYIWKWVTEEIDPVIGESNKVLIELIDRVRMLDNDLIRLNQKVNVILSLRDKEQDEVHKKPNIFTDNDK